VAKILVIGAGGREHALAWKLAQSSKVDKIYVAPGNGGTKNIAENIDIKVTDVDGLLQYAKDNKIDLTVVGQDAALEAGVVDTFKSTGLAIFGPTKSAARIETSKVFSKDLMRTEKIPTANYRTFSDAKKALGYTKNQSFPLVIKADGLAEGKGAVICEDLESTQKVIEDIMVRKIFGGSGENVVIEEFMKGQEVSCHAICDGTKAVLFPASQDHKQVFNGDKGPNTGGMGVIAPVLWVGDEHRKIVEEQIVQRALDGLAKSGSPFTGILYPGLMIDGANVKVVEFNARFGDPETEAYMRLLDSDLFDLFTACVQGKLDPAAVKWQSGFAISVALASGGYPGKYEKGKLISGIAEAERDKDIVVFHAGTRTDPDGFKTNGGRVLHVTATGKTLDVAIKKAYHAVSKIHFEGMHYRKDIGTRTLP
jgi:phosphoribosylamine---glycine ligase